MPGVSPKILRKAREAQSTSTRLVCEFFTWKGNGFIGRTDLPSARQVVGTPTGFSHSKTAGQASGTFTISMKRPDSAGNRAVTEFDYQKIWGDPEGVWVMIHWICDNTKIDGLFGAIDSISGSITRSEQGTRAESYTINGRDFGRVFEDTKPFINPISPVPIASYSFLVDTVKPLVELVTPADFVKKLTEAWLGNGGANAQAWEMPPGLKSRGETFFKMLNFTGVQKMTPALHGVTSNPRVFDPGGSDGSLWDMLQHYSNGVLNEFWVDLAPSPSQPNALSGLQPTVFLRERPFPTQESRVQWDLLRTWKLGREDIKDRDVSKGGSATRFNYWLLYPGGFGAPEMSGFMQQGVYPVSTGLPGGIPIVNLQSIRRYGLRKWEQTTIFCPANLGSDPTNDAALTYTGIPTEQWRQLVAAWLKKVHDWYVVTPKQLSGRIVTTRAFPEIRIGHRIYEETDDGGIYFYVEGVEHVWQYPGSGRTILTVTRGEYANTNLLAESYQSYIAHLVLDAAANEALEAAQVSREILDQQGFDPRMIDNNGD